MLWYTQFNFMMMSIVNGVCKGISFLFAKQQASGPDEMTMWWLSARCCHFSHDFLMLFSHGSPPQNDKQMPNAFMDVIFHPSHSLAFRLFLFCTSFTLTPPAVYFLLTLNLTFTFSFSQPLFLSVSVSTCRYCASSRLQWLWSCLHSRMPPSALLL